MPISLHHTDADLEGLLDKLELDTPSLTPRDIELLTLALRTLVADQLALLRLQRLLAIHGESAARMDAILTDARTSLERRATSERPMFDPDQHAEARAALARRVDDARSGRDVILAALAFARDIAPVIVAAPLP